jgi:hypothetical protein
MPFKRVFFIDNTTHLRLSSWKNIFCFGLLRHALFWNLVASPHTIDGYFYPGWERGCYPGCFIVVVASITSMNTKVMITSQPSKLYIGTRKLNISQFYLFSTKYKITHVKLVNKMCSQQACSKLVNKLYQCCYFIKLPQGCHSQLVDKLLNCRTITSCWNNL